VKAVPPGLTVVGATTGVPVVVLVAVDVIDVGLTVGECLVVVAATGCVVVAATGCVVVAATGCVVVPPPPPPGSVGVVVTGGVVVVHAFVGE
jgi:hypothetical protein